MVVWRVRLGDGPVEGPAVAVPHHGVEEVLQHRRVEDPLDLVVDGAPALGARGGLVAGGGGGGDGLGHGLALALRVDAALGGGAGGLPGAPAARHLLD